jgi:formylglycine-generating enzyme required for sulfatase activity/uncharacterized membrane protein
LPKQQPTPDLLQSGDQPKDNGPPTDFTNTLGMKFKLIPAGKFTMGSPKEEIDRCLKELAGAWLWQNLATEGPEHPVEITQPFYLGATEVTVGQFRQFVEEEGYQVGDGRWRNPGFDQTDQHPVVWVSWNNAVDFCKWLSKKEGKEYRLPTEAEWEYSCRAGKAGSRYCFGDDDAQLENYTWFNQNSRGGTHPVGKKKPNAWGLYDMHGNASEHCQDNYDPDYYKSSPVKDPPGGAAAPDQRGARSGHGGSWKFGPVICRSAFRGYSAPDQRWDFCGFRVLLVSPPGDVRTESGAKDKPTSPAIAPSTDTDRRAAEYVLSIGGTVRVDDGDRDIRAGQGELPAGVFRLTYVDLSGNKQVTDSGLAACKGCKNLTTLALDGCKQITDAGLAHFKDCKDLTSLNLNDTQVSDAGLIHLKDCKALTALWLARTKVSDVGLAHFKDCKNLTQLYVAGTRVGDEGLIHFKDRKNLTSLNLNDTRVSDAGLGYFQDCKNLTHLDLARTKVSDAGLAHFKDCKDLTELHLDGTLVGDAGVAHFKDCKNLTSLKLNGARVGDEGLGYFQDCKGLTELNLAGTRASDAGLAHFKDCKNLTELHLDRTRVGDAGLAHLKGMPLTVLWIDNTAITDLTPLQGMPLEHIYLTPKKITRGLDILRGMKGLKIIGIAWNQSWPAAEFWKRYEKEEFKD